MAGCGHSNPGCANQAARGLDRLHRTLLVAPDADDLAVLNDVDAQRIGGAGVTPGHGIVPRGAAATLQRGPEHRVADVAYVQWRTEFLGLLRAQPLIVDAVGAIGMHVALDHLYVVYRVGQHHDPSRREHDVVVERLRQRFPQLQRMIVERGALIEQVVGADDGGVAAGVAAAYPAFLQHRDLTQPVVARQVIGRAQPVSAAADDDRVVSGLR